ncbi:MAG: molybdenum cofactor biosynthesis protein MoaE, partial [Deltaproteobacteria bacterium]|nr:molybdenum cofactor biosynthesis protein MoaE [Deltaproteobacteria bacterium]
MRNKNQITDKPIPTDELERDLNDPSCGGVVTFVGKVRNHHEGKKVTGLTYEAYAPMAEKVFKTIGSEAVEKFGVKEARIVHRIGPLKIGDVAVWIGVQSPHRAEAFAACQYAIDELKQRAPIWKKEHYMNADSEWVKCHCAEVQIPPNPPFTPRKGPLSGKGGVTNSPPLKKGEKGGFKIAVILAGGQSKRFGSDKVWAPFQGKPLIQISIDALKASSFDVMLSGPRTKLRTLGLPVIEDEMPLEGPLAALKSVWRAIDADRIFVIAVDMPFIQPAIIEKLWEESRDADVTLLQKDDGPSPLPGVYTRRCVPEIDSLIEEGRRDLHSLCEKNLKIRTIDLR